MMIQNSLKLLEEISLVEQKILELEEMLCDVCSETDKDQIIKELISKYK